MRRALVPLTALVLAVSGCNLKLDTAALRGLLPTPRAVEPATPKPLAEPAKTGNVTGFVYGQAGRSQPIPLAEVRAGAIKTLTGNPDPIKAVAQENEFDNDANAQKSPFDVFHDFNDGAGPVLTQRILRKYVPAPDPSASIADQDRVKYVYLRPGEFFLEAVPEGDAVLIAKFGTRESQPNPNTVYAKQIVTGVTLTVAVPEPVVIEGNRIPKVVEWMGTSPETGISVGVSVKTTQSDQGTRTETTLTYKPDPPEVELSLAAPPGSGGTTIKGYDLVYSYNTPRRQAAGQPPVQIGPDRFPIANLTVPPASDLDFGPAVKLKVALGSAALRAAFGATAPDEQPGVIQANIQFIDDGGFTVEDKTFQQLKVTVPIRAL